MLPVYVSLVIFMGSSFIHKKQFVDFFPPKRFVCEKYEKLDCEKKKTQPPAPDNKAVAT